MGVNIFIQFSLSGVYLLAGTGIFLSSPFPTCRGRETAGREAGDGGEPGGRHFPGVPRTPSASAATGGNAGRLLGRGSAVSMAAPAAGSSPPARRFLRLRRDTTLVKPPAAAAWVSMSAAEHTWCRCRRKGLAGAACASAGAAAGRDVGAGGSGTAAGGVARPAGAELHRVRLQVGAPQRPPAVPGQHRPRHRPHPAVRAARRPSGAAAGGERRPLGNDCQGACPEPGEKKQELICVYSVLIQ